MRQFFISAACSVGIVLTFSQYSAAVPKTSDFELLSVSTREKSPSPDSISVREDTEFIRETKNGEVFLLLSEVNSENRELDPEAKENVQIKVGSSPLEESRARSGLKFRFQNVPLPTVIATVMRELGYSYVVDPRVKGTTSIYTASGIGKEDLFVVLKQLLQLNGQAILKKKDLYLILPLAETINIPHDLLAEAVAGSGDIGGIRNDPEQSVGEQKHLPVGQGSEEPKEQLRGQEESEDVFVSAMSELEQRSEESKQGIVTYIVPLHHIPSAEMVQMITPFVSNGANIINYASSNILIVTDFRENINQALKIIRLLDTQYFDINTVDLIPIRYHQAVDVALDLNQVFSPDDQTAGVRIVAIERLNSILVVTHSPSVFQTVKEWVQKFDSPATGSNLQTFVYQVENNTAINIAEVLAQLYQDGVGRPLGATSGGQSEGQPRLQSTLPTRDSGFVRSQRLERFRAAEEVLGPSLAGRPMSNQTGIRAVVNANVKIIVNEFNNSLIIQATETDYQFLLETIKKLDVLPRQVLIEARIYSVELRDDLSFGVAAFLQKRGAALAAGDGQEQTTSGSTTTGQISSEGALSVMTQAFIGQARQLEALVNALRSKTNVEILEAPRLLALDGMQAQINVGAEVPVTTASFGDPLTAGDSTVFVNSIQFRPTGTTLLIMPHISSGGIVTMDMAIEVSSASGPSLTPTINRNFVTTSLIVQDSQTIAIAGIISDQVDVMRKRIPVLGDIPILGALFGQTVRNRKRSELIFFITPHVIKNLPTATELTMDFRRSLRKAYEFIRNQESEERKLILERRKQERDTQ